MTSKFRSTWSFNRSPAGESSEIPYPVLVPEGYVLCRVLKKMQVHDYPDRTDYTILETGETISFPKEATAP